MTSSQLSRKALSNSDLIKVSSEIEPLPPTPTSAVVVEQRLPSA